MKYPNKARKEKDNPNWIDGRGRHPLYGIWHAMISRCENPKDSKYKYYGGRGISVCDRWHDFSLFVKDVGERPPGTYPSGRSRYEIDRIDNDGNYEPGNFRWATRSEQLRNRRSLITHCPQGHDYSKTGKLNSRGDRVCAECRRRQAREWARRNRAAHSGVA